MYLRFCKFTQMRFYKFLQSYVRDRLFKMNIHILTSFLFFTHAKEMPFKLETGFKNTCVTQTLGGDLG